MKIVNPTAVLGENTALEYLRKKRFKIIERNFRKGYGEIDIVAIKDHVLIFVEVKTRSSEEFATIRESIAPWKLKTIVKTAQFYKLIHPDFPESLRIDAIFILLSENKSVDRLEHVENITGF